MSLLVALITGLLMGVAFGFALEKARVFEPGMIVGQMQLRNFIMLKVFLAAVATGALVLAALNGLGFVKLQPKAAVYAADIAGGLLLGAGIALAGACPGTVLVQIGAGYRDALATLVGGLAGAVAFSYLEPTISGTLLGVSAGKLVLTDILDVPYWQGALWLAGIVAVSLTALEAWRPWTADIGRNLDGDLNLAARSSTGPTRVAQGPIGRSHPRPL